MPADISYKVDVLSDQTRDNVGFKNSQGVQQILPKLIADAGGGNALAGPDGRVVIGGAPSAFASRALTVDDDSEVLVCATSQTATVNTGLPTDFGCTFSGPVSFAGTATVTDKRSAGDADPTCSLVQTGANAYKAIGTKV